jgi:hypothetical protein
MQQIAQTQTREAEEKGTWLCFVGDSFYSRLTERPSQQLSATPSHPKVDLPCLESACAVHKQIASGERERERERER